MNKTCTKCGETKDKKLFVRIGNTCKECKAKYDRQYEKENENKISDRKKIYYIQNKIDIIETQKIYYTQNKDKKLEYSKNHYNINKTCKDRPIFSQVEKEENIRTRENNKRKNNPSYALKKDISRTVASMLSKLGSSKKGISSSKKLPYTIEQLKEYIESLFEPWMNWTNRGIYNIKTWNDDDDSTKTWQLDHIIPHSDLPYDSMDHPNFKKCWGLSNLRPLSAKQNYQDGIKR